MTVRAEHMGEVLKLIREHRGWHHPDMGKLSAPVLQRQRVGQIRVNQDCGFRISEEEPRLSKPPEANSRRRATGGENPIVRDRETHTIVRCRPFASHLFDDGLPVALENPFQETFYLNVTVVVAGIARVDTE